MNFNEFKEKFRSEIGDKEKATIVLLPGPTKIKVTQSDSMAFDIIDWLEKKMPENATIGDYLDVLHDAQWWITFWQALDKD